MKKDNSIMLTNEAEKKTLIFCVLYPGLDDYIVLDYVNSIINQTDKCFDWLMINDNCENNQKRLFPEKVIWIDLNTTLSFGKIRELGILFAINNKYDYIIFSDIDDFYSENRVELSKIYLKQNEFVFTEIQVINFKNEITHSNFIQNLDINRKPNAIHDILDFNYIGLSHSAIRTNVLKDFEISECTEVVDWWIFSLLLLKNHTGRFIPNANTFYRQNNDNYVGVFRLLDQKRLQRGIDIKINHYTGLVEYCKSRQMLEMADSLEEKKEEIIELKRLIQDNKFSEKYIKIVNDNFNTLYRGWWSEIIPIKKWELL